MSLTPGQIAEFDRDGFLVMRDLLTSPEKRRLQDGVLREYEHRFSFHAESASMPAGKYSLTEASMGVPDVNFIVDHGDMVGAIDQLLRARARVMSFVFYLKPPGSEGTIGDYQGTHDGAHCDYKPFRPVGSSLNWMFAIIPLVDYTPDIGPLTVSPGSHRLTALRPGSGRVTRVDRATADRLAPFVDPELRAGDVLLMHGFMWHSAPPNRSQRLRYGLYSKYMAADAPPGCGPYVFTDAAWRVLADAGRRADLLANHSDLLVGDARLLVERGGRALVVQGEDGSWGLPGAPAQTRRKVPATDADNVIARLEDALPNQLGGAPDWVSYLGDFENEAPGSTQPSLSRVYGYPDDEEPWLDGRPSGSQADHAKVRWLDAAGLARGVDAGDIREPYAADALERWLTDNVTRGVGQSSPTAHRRPA